MAAEVLDCEPDDITVFGADTDASPYDSGSYASSTTYITGMATQNAALELRENIKKIGAQMLGDCLDQRWILTAKSSGVLRTECPPESVLSQMGSSSNRIFSL